MEALTRGERAAATRRGGGALVFVGFMGSGKSTAARAVAAELGGDPVDSDRALEFELGEPIESFFDREGERAFREREEALVLRLLERADGKAVALGGGAPQSERVREALHAHTVVHLEVEPEEAWRRASGRGRPLARDRVRFDELHAERRAVYESVADVLVPPAGRETARRTVPALLAVREARAKGDLDMRMVWAHAVSGDYPVFFGRGLIAAGFAFPTAMRRFVVTDENVALHHRLPARHTIALAAGEQTKVLSSAEVVLRRLAGAGAERGDLLAAVGGGVVGDLGGFCAAVYQRGMQVLQVPTTLVAQVDSAYGGKTGVDLPEGKNYVGAYHQPSAVICDPAALETLPREEIAAGFAEVVKTALIAGGPLWARVRSGALDDEVILGCLRTKLAVVSEDERDEGRRPVLNLGHTVGHAIEAATGYRALRHGEAVAIGLLVALRLSGTERLRDEVAELLASHGLPSRFKGASVEDVVELVKHDKKREGGRVPFVLVEAPGKVTPGHVVPPVELRAAVQEVCEE